MRGSESCGQAAKVHKGEQVSRVVGSGAVRAAAHPAGVGQQRAANWVCDMRVAQSTRCVTCVTGWSRRTAAQNVGGRSGLSPRKDLRGVRV